MPRVPCSHIDRHLGERIRLRRIELGISRVTLGEAIGISPQQVQKYERGSNRIAAALLYEIACVLQMPITYFYDDIELQPGRP